MTELLLDIPRAAREHMAYDLELAERAEPVVRFFQWAPPAVSLGWKQPAPAWVQTLSTAQVVERPTGGALAVHGTDVSVAMVVPRTPATSLHALLQAAAFSAVQLCRSFGVAAEPLWDTTANTPLTYCLADASPYAVCIAGRKVAGFAARRFAKSCLIQGSLLVRPLAAPIAGALPATVARQFAQRAVALSEAAGGDLTETEVIERWAASWAAWWTGAQGLHAV